MIPKFKKHYELEKKLQEFVESYKTNAVLYNFPIFYSAVDQKKLLLYLQIIKHLQDAQMINSHEVLILQLDQDLEHEICLFCQFNSLPTSSKSSISNAQPFINIGTRTIASTKLQNNPRIVESYSEILKKLALEHYLFGVKDKFLMRDEVENSNNEYKKNKEIK